MKTMTTAQTPRVRMSDYRFMGIRTATLHEKINIRANILHCASPVRDRLLR